MTCPDPSSPVNGYIEVSEYSGQYEYGSVATYHCNPGFRLEDSGPSLGSSLVCGPEGVWQPEVGEAAGAGVRVTHQGSDVAAPLPRVLVCEPVTCPDPPRVSHAVLELVNGSATLHSLLGSAYFTFN